MHDEVAFERSRVRKFLLAYWADVIFFPVNDSVVMVRTLAGVDFVAVVAFESCDLAIGLVVRVRFYCLRHVVAQGQCFSARNELNHFLRSGNSFRGNVLLIKSSKIVFWRWVLVKDK